jgi:hypothetical protein
MKLQRSAVAVSIALAGAAVVASGPGAAVAAGGGGGVDVVTQHLDGPFGLQAARAHRGLLVAESVSGQVTRVFDGGRQRTILSGAGGVAGVAGSPRRVFAVTGGPNEDGVPPAGRIGVSRVVRMTYNGKGVKVIANLLKYERRHNPDGQVQLVDGKPVDALSNPFAMTWSRFGLLVADGGANDVLKVNKHGRTSTFFVPPSITSGDCANQKQNDDQFGNSCDAVPTGLAFGPDGNLYISALTSEVAGQGRVYVVNRDGKLLRTLTGFTAPTGVAVAPGGTIYVSELLQGAPEGNDPPPPGFDPAEVGQIVKVAKDGSRTYAQVTMPSGLLWTDGNLYASAWSVGVFLNLAHAGQIVSVDPSSFVK